MSNQLIRSEQVCADTLQTMLFTRKYDPYALDKSMSPVTIILLLLSSVCTLKANKNHEPGALEDQCTKSLSHLKKMKIKVSEEGTSERNYRVFFTSAHGLISPFHDIPLYSNFHNKTFNMVVENPSHTNNQMEVSVREAMNPLIEGINKGGYIWNYGILPQTWEDPREVDPHTGHKGDGHPLDVLDLGTEQAAQGDIIQVKILGAIGLIVEHKIIDWKILAINVSNLMAPILNDMSDVETHYPEGTMKFAVSFFRDWNTRKNTTLVEGDGEGVKNRAFALKVIEESNRKWIQLMQGKVKPRGVSILNTCVEGSKGKISFVEAQDALDNRWSLEHFFGVGKYSTTPARGHTKTPPSQFTNRTKP
ncbi:hypothetical protein WDU94_000368 [Cyamophila willieti]